MRLVNFFQGYLVEYFAIIASRLWTAGGTRERACLVWCEEVKKEKIPKLMEKILESTNSDGLGETAWNEWGGVSSDFRLSAAHCWVFTAHWSKNEKMRIFKISPFKKLKFVLKSKNVWSKKVLYRCRKQISYVGEFGSWDFTYSSKVKQILRSKRKISFWSRAS